MAKDQTDVLAAIGDELRGFIEQLAQVPDERAAAMARQLERALQFAPEQRPESAQGQQSLTEQADNDLNDDDDDGNDDGV